MSAKEESSTETAGVLQQLQKHQVPQELAERLAELITQNRFSIDELDEKAYATLRDVTDLSAALKLLKECGEQSNGSAVEKLCDLLDKISIKPDESETQEINNGEEQSLPSSSEPASPAKKQNFTQKDNTTTSQSSENYIGPDKAKLKEILARTGYNHEITSGQRKYGGPPPGWQGSPPSTGCEIFVGKIPKDIFEDRLIELFEPWGKIWDLRLMIDPFSRCTRGYCFITFCTKEEAEQAQSALDGYEIRKGQHIKVNLSVPNLRLFVGNIPKSRSKEAIFQEFTKITPGLLEVIVYSSPDDRKRNRGFCFLEYDSHKSASQAKRKLSPGNVKVWDCDILVDWADPQEEPDNDTMSKVKVLYVRNLVTEVSESQLRELFEVHGPVQRVKKIKDYAFVHFDEREHALQAMQELNGSQLHGVEIEVSLAKPPSDRKKKEEVLRNRERRVMMMMQQRSVLVPGVPRGAAILPPVPPPMPPNMAAAAAAAPSLATGARAGRTNRNGQIPSVATAPYGQRNMARPNYGPWWSAWYNYMNTNNPWWNSYNDQRMFGAGGNPAVPVPNAAYGAAAAAAAVAAAASAAATSGARPNRPHWQPHGMMNNGPSSNGQKWNKGGKQQQNGGQTNSHSQSKGSSGNGSAAKTQ